MGTPAENLAKSLELLKSLQGQGRVAIRSSNLTRVHRQRLVKNGFLIEVMKGWYYPSNPLLQPGETTSWSISYWGFCSQYLTHRFGDDWTLSAENSLLWQTGNRQVPQQLIVKSPKASNNVQALLHRTTILGLKAKVDKNLVEKVDGVNVLKLPYALIFCAPSFFRNNELDCRAALAAIRSPSELLGPLLDGGHSLVASRLAAAYENIGRKGFSKQIVKTMQAAGYNLRLDDPFAGPTTLELASDEFSPAVNRLRLLWQSMRQVIVDKFPVPPSKGKRSEVLAAIDEKYSSDAYHSLSIEGYHVSQKLIDHVRRGDWNPDGRSEDEEQQNALVARGYWLTFQRVRKCIERVFAGHEVSDVIASDLSDWYLQLFSPAVTAGLIEAHDLAGYRNNQVYIRGSYHVPPSCENVRLLMPAFFRLLKEEPNGAVRAILGHFCFVYVHPYPDGNGRLGRFLMNLCLVAAGYPWTTVKESRRDGYFAALEKASIENDIGPFVDFLLEHLKEETN